MCGKSLQKGTMCGKVSLSNVKKYGNGGKERKKMFHKLPMEKVLAE